MRKYSKTHQWIDLATDGTALVGITRHAAAELGEVQFVELPDVGVMLRVGDCFAVLESVKAAAEAYLPAAGTVLAVNEGLLNYADALNADPEGAGWICKISDVAPTALDGLMDAAAYAEYCKE